MEKVKIVSFYDLDVYKNTYAASITVINEVVHKLPIEEKADLCDQLARSSKAIPPLIAEGYGKRHQRLGFQKYLADAMGEVNETIVSLSHTRDLYGKFVDPKLCSELIEIYNISGKQLYRLLESWNKIKQNYQPTLTTNLTTKPFNQSNYQPQQLTNQNDNEKGVIML